MQNKAKYDAKSNVDCIILKEKSKKKIISIFICILFLFVETGIFSCMINLSINKVFLLAVKIFTLIAYAEHIFLPLSQPQKLINLK